MSVALRKDVKTPDVKGNAKSNVKGWRKWVPVRKNGAKPKSSNKKSPIAWA
jgi:hypothetical protein